MTAEDFHNSGIQTVSKGEVVTTDIQCPACKQNTGFTKEIILEMFIDEIICCPHCDSMVFSNKPRLKPPYVWTGTSTGYDWD